MPQGEQSITLTAGPVACHHIHPPSSTLSFTPSLTSLSSMICKYTYLTFLLWLSDTSQTRCLDIIASREVISLEPIDQPLLSDPSCPHLPFVWWLGCPRRCWRYVLGNSSAKRNLISFSFSNWSKWEVECKEKGRKWLRLKIQCDSLVTEAAAAKKEVWEQF